MHKRPIGYVPGKGLPYDKKLKPNPRYNHVKGKLKTGKTVRDYKVISNKHIVKRKGEAFMRIKGSTLIKLLDVQFFLYVDIRIFKRKKPILRVCITTKTKLRGKKR